MGVGQHVIAIEKQLNAMTQEIKDLGKTDNSARSRVSKPYSQAIELAEQGADVDDIIKRCRVSRAEAELMSLLQLGQQAWPCRLEL